MDNYLLREMLCPFVAAPLSERDLFAISAYIDLLLRWNAKINLTSIRDPRDIVRRHIGESLFAAEHLLDGRNATGRVVDVGSGAGFPGLPFKIYSPNVQLTMIESNHRKASFLKEAIRTLHFENATVFVGRADSFPGKGGLVTMRAVERFEKSVAVAASLVDDSSSAKLGLLIGQSQLDSAHILLPKFTREPPIHIPDSESRLLLIAKRL